MKKKATKVKRSKVYFDGSVEAGMYRYHRLLLDAKTEVQARLWFSEFILYRKEYDTSFR